MASSKIKPNFAELEQATENPRHIRDLTKPVKKNKPVESPIEAVPIPLEPEVLYHPFIEFKIEMSSAHFENLDDEGNPTEELPVYYIQKKFPDALQALNDWTSGKASLLCHSVIETTDNSVSLIKPVFFGTELGNNAKVTINCCGDIKTVRYANGTFAEPPEIIFNSKFSLV